MSQYALSFFASGNGDSVLLEAGSTTIMTDIHYCKGATDPEDDGKPDFAPAIRKACAGNKLDIFVLTHPDADHVRGADAVFHLGSPDSWDMDPDEGEPKILIKEIWCSPYSANGAYETNASRPLLEEIRRRKKLSGSLEGYKDGNRLMVRSADDAIVSGSVGNASWRVLAPTMSEAHIDEPEEGEPRESCNRTSLAIQWSVNVYGTANKVLLLGDATVEVLERIHDDILPKAPEALDWHVLLAPHHSSRRSIGYVVNPGLDEEFVPSDKALAVLGRQVGNGNIVSSSRRFGRATSPPSTYARNRYVKILARVEKLSDVKQSDRDRFLVTGGSTSAAPEHVVFDLTYSGPSLRKKVKAPAIATSAVGGGGSYG